MECRKKFSQLAMSVQLKIRGKRREGEREGKVREEGKMVGEEG